MGGADASQLALKKLLMSDTKLQSRLFRDTFRIPVPIKEKDRSSNGESRSRHGEIAIIREFHQHLISSSLAHQSLCPAEI